MTNLFRNYRQTKMTKNKKQKWAYEIHHSPLGETGDTTSSITFTNGIETFETSSDIMEIKDCEKFVELLNLMPDLWSHKLDEAEFSLRQGHLNWNHFRKSYPPCYQTGAWDGKRSDVVICLMADGKYQLARAYEYDDNFLNVWWYDSDDMELGEEIVFWANIPHPSLSMFSQFSKNHDNI